MTCYNKSLYIVRRDMRIDDNTALNEALHLSEQVQACFIFDPAQVDGHPYQSRPALQFMLQSLDDLRGQFRARGAYLAIVHGEPEKIVKEWVLACGIKAVFVNRDYTPFSRHRDHCLQQVCMELGIEWHACADVLLNEPEQALKSDGSAYKVFTAFYNNARRIPVGLPKTLADGRFLRSAGMPAVRLRVAQNECRSERAGRASSGFGNIRCPGKP